MIILVVILFEILTCNVVTILNIEIKIVFYKPAALSLENTDNTCPKKKKNQFNIPYIIQTAIFPTLKITSWLQILSLHM